MKEDTETLIVRAAQMLSYEESAREIYRTFVDEGVDAETAFLATRAGQVLQKSHRSNPVTYFWQNPSPPRTISTLGGREKFAVPKRMWDFAVTEARENKRWAEKVSKDPKWRATASGMGVQMVDEYLKSSIEDLATRSIQYLQMRASATSQGRHYNRLEYEKYISLGGKL